MPRTRNDILPSFEEIDAVLRYEPHTGKLFWKIHRPGPQRSDREAGNRDRLGYIGITFKYRVYMAHRIVWLLVHGEWPPHMIDHINGDPSDNRISNLRPATYIQNRANAGPAAKSLTGIKGVRRQKNRFRVTIHLDGKDKNLGSFTDISEAAAAYERAAEQIHGEFAFHRSRA